MDRLAKILVILGFMLLIVAASSRFVIGRPYMLLGVRALSLLLISNTLFILAILVKVFNKK